MLCAVEMFGGVFVLRRVAAAHFPANETHAKVDPGVAALHAFLALMLVGVPHLDLIQVCAIACHGLLLILVCVMVNPR
jgi:hypothetical protein